TQCVSSGDLSLAPYDMVSDPRLAAGVGLIYSVFSGISGLRSFTNESIDSSARYPVDEPFLDRPGRRPKKYLTILVRNNCPRSSGIFQYGRHHSHSLS